MKVRKASAAWEGNLTEGRGKMKLGSGAFEGKYSFASRFEDGDGTNPEELIGAAHAGCFSMALSGLLAEQGFTAKRIYTTANVSLVKSGDGFKIDKIELNTEADIPGIDESKFKDLAGKAKDNCPVSMAMAGVEIHLQARLKS